MRNALTAIAASAIFISGCNHSSSTVPQLIGKTQPGNQVGAANPLMKYSILYSFHGPDGKNPNGSLVQDAAGNFYGTASGTGAQRHGIVFKLDPRGSESVFFQFKAGLSTGRQPSGGVVQDANGNFYGVTWTGGSNDLGVVYKLDPAGNETILHSFNGADGANPQGTLSRDAFGNLYGTTYFGGSKNFGVVFKISSTGHETLLHSFFTYSTDGAYPEAGMIRTAAGDLFGTTNEGGSHYPLSDGTVFKIDSRGRESVFHSFNGSDGAAPETRLIQDTAGNLYGTTAGGGGNNDGVVFMLDPSGHFTMLHSFTGSDGLDPSGTLIRDSAGNLYGPTSWGGSSNIGVIFQLDPSNNLIVLHNFSGADGSRPGGSLYRDAAGNLFGTASSGGASNDGVIFELTP
jgi:uncharacterized repeat protein (TIGR03803 family)